MKILFVSPEYPYPKPSGGIASYVRDISEGLAARGHEIKIIAMDDQRPHDAPLYIHREGRVEVHFMGKNYSGRLSKILEHPSLRHAFTWPVSDLAVLIPPVNAFLHYRRLLRTWKPDIVESYDWQACGLFIHLFDRGVPKVFRGAGHVKVIEEHNGKKWTRQHDSQHRIERWTARRSSVVVPCSSLLGRDEAAHFDLPPEKIRPIANCVAPELLTDDCTDAGEERRVIRVCFVGRIEHRKGADVLLEAGHRLHKDFPDVRYTFIGKDCIDVNAYLATSNFSEDYRRRLHFVGQIPRHEIKKYLLNSDFAVFPSRYEPFGIVALEAMACGLPVIVSSAGGWCEAVEDGVAGVVVEPGDVESLRRAMERMICLEPGERREMGRRARNAVMTRFSAGEIAAKMEALYEGLVTRGQRKEG
ncbi:MAG TPA: glycosyltransferase family 4 protein [Syntrophales bacterium]|nr:glycosyltransferase family 4 protein [Syntrophales bacterium]